MLICNIDGTIADNAHRRRALADGTFDWDYFLRPLCLMTGCSRTSEKFSTGCRCGIP
jgi:hypothetical protein